MESVQKAVRDAADGLRNLAFGPQQVTEAATQHGEEPVSGVQGRGTPTDPYDAGNRDEQPGAPQTQDNTAVIPEPLESITPIETKPTDVSSAQSTSDQGPGAGAGAGLTTALPVAPQPSSTPAQEKSQSQSTTPNTNLESGSGPGNPTVDEPSPAQEQSNPTASSADTTTSTGSSSSSNNNAPTQSEPEKPAPEQRSQAMPDGDSSSQQKEDGGVPGDVERAPPATTQQVSVEALKGPQGPAPRDAYEFEKEMDGKPSKTRTDQDTNEKGDSGHHHHKMGHVKERLGKVFKHGNH
ncbi:hypothetical protein IFM58399_03977 [Aspergillus lentulus]|uniref:Uncharacterized protein n=1 Tax=Aspergillus lentulus TaxID=293939 RepID=A0AAN5YYC4_ASPLE|nr:uncharacterized protein IFM58399_03977 [Aspergillus lentulus]KAF4156765.1 hypothetical protein CNMCM6069_006410 [Aspergillus lentulus]KAF4166095.1 hypothetical protein CNMCM6936_007075 [Aspergillus lentulus]KAF4178001.1 hypothetical protein CNMCM8060_004871 [Aspergillus lentulus]KAF4196754.1 hypothetical protein CNMCM8694_004476 [Aspergillus lentulus]KAF4208293.1 hypothetical protein CNMCM8927_000797 [Aspergillus lentulus]